MPDSARYFRADDSTQTEGGGAWVKWSDLDPIEMLPGLRFQPILGDNVMANLVHIDPHTEAPVHWHEEEQISIVIDGEFEFEVERRDTIDEARRRRRHPAERATRSPNPRLEVPRDGRLPSATKGPARSDGVARNGLNTHN